MLEMNNLNKMRLNMKSKILNFFLILTSLVGYLEWGKNSHSFLFDVEVVFFSKVFTNPYDVIHPLTILPLVGQILLFSTLFQKSPNKKVTFGGIFCLGLLLAFMFLIGLLSFNYKIMISTIPFFVVVVLTKKHYHNMKINSKVETDTKC